MCFLLSSRKAFPLNRAQRQGLKINLFLLFRNDACSNSVEPPQVFVISNRACSLQTKCGPRKNLVLNKVIIRTNLNVDK